MRWKRLLFPLNNVKASIVVAGATTPISWFVPREEEAGYVTTFEARGKDRPWYIIVRVTGILTMKYTSRGRFSAFGPLGRPTHPAVSPLPLQF